MTPLIDIVFLLIIFFLVVCKFIEAENFPVSVPDLCDSAEQAMEDRTGEVTLTMIRTVEGKIDFVVGSAKIETSDSDKLVVNMAERIDTLLQAQPDDHRIVTLRIDKEICFSDAQYALAAVAASSATDVKLAVLKKGSHQTNSHKGSE